MLAAAGAAVNGERVARVYLWRETEWWRRIHLEGEPPSPSYTDVSRATCFLCLRSPPPPPPPMLREVIRRPFGPFLAVWPIWWETVRGPALSVSVCLVSLSFSFPLSFSLFSSLVLFLFCLLPPSSVLFSLYLSIYLSNNFFLPLTSSFQFSSVLPRLPPPPPLPAHRWGRCAFAGERARPCPPAPASRSFLL